MSQPVITSMEELLAELTKLDPGTVNWPAFYNYVQSTGLGFVPADFAQASIFDEEE